MEHNKQPTDSTGFETALARARVMHEEFQVYTTCRPLHTNRRCGLDHGETCKGSTCCWNYIEDYWPCADRLLAVNTIGTQLRGPINSGLTQWCTRYVGINKWTPPRTSGGIPRVSTKFSLSVENEQAVAGRDDRTRLARPNSRARTGTGKYYVPLLS